MARCSVSDGHSCETCRAVGELCLEKASFGLVPCMFMAGGLWGGWLAPYGPCACTGHVCALCLLYVCQCSLSLAALFVCT
jgi:hypothetical protein